jgi:endonuclease-3
VENPVDNVDNPPKKRASCRQTGLSGILPRHALRTLTLLEEAYPEAHCALRHDSPWQLLVATILSAQCTDTRVNLVTPGLFVRFPDPAALALATPAELEELIRSTGFYRNKAASLIGCAKGIVTHHGGIVPRTMTDLVKLPGIGRKTANVILGNAFGQAGLVVDTHVGRVARRLGWATANQPERVERELCMLLPRGRWTQASHVLIWHGRRCCRAQVAHCSACPVQERCLKAGVNRER